jgi:hypothetical protein
MTQQAEARGKIRAPFVLVFHLGHHAQRLTKILLMQAYYAALRAGLPV